MTIHTSSAPRQLIERSCDLCGSTSHRTLLEQGDSAYRQCSDCGLIYGSPIPEDYTSANESYYVGEVDKYAAKITGRLAANKRVLAPLARYRKCNRLLELGCNTGATLVAAEQLGWEAYGVDISRAASAYARDVQGLNVFTGTLEAAGFDDGQFDVVYSNAVMEHLEHPLATLVEVARVLRPGGAFFADTVNWDSYTRRILGNRWRYLEPLHHVHLYTPENVRELARRCNLIVRNIRTTGVRTRNRHRGELYAAPWYVRACKGVLSAATRITLKGDSIQFLLVKP